MNRSTLGVLVTMASWPLVLLGCDSLPTPPGKPVESDRYVAPNDVVDFDALYSLHCSGCHGAEGKLGPARALNDPLYLALVPRPALESTIRAGIAGTPMPAFGHGEGGPLTEAQLDALIDGLTQRWGGEAPKNLPAYAGPGGGSAERGRTVFATYCADCHGSDGRGGKRAGSVVNPAYLGVVSNQGLRSSVIVGRPDLEMPDYRHYVSGRVMSEREITDVVAWLVAQRPRYPGQPYPSANEAKSPRAARAPESAQGVETGPEQERKS